MPVQIDPAAMLRDAKLRVTAPRLAVLSEVNRQPHADADLIITNVRRQLGSVSKQAVYDVLAALTEAGLVRRIQPAGSPARFEARVGDNHHHIVCRRCGVVGDVDCATGDPPCLEPSSSDGFLIDEAEITFWGLCAACQQQPQPAT